MRNLFVACAFLLCAFLLVACDNPARTARKEVDRITRVTQKTELGVRRETREVMLEVAKAEGSRRGQELKAAGCGPANATQPSSALVDPCKGIVAASEARYEKRQGEVMSVAKRVDAAISAVYAVLLVVLDIVEDVELASSQDSWKKQLTELISRAVSTANDMKKAYELFRTSIRK